MQTTQWPEAGVPAQKAEGYLNNAWRVKAMPEWEAAHHLLASIILWTDPRYPAMLKELPDAPALLYTVGDESLLSAPCVAVVGSRNSSGAALDFTAAAAQRLSDAGVTVVSGLAFGADSRAHSAALSGPGRTVAVMPGGVDVIFPSGQSERYRRIAEQGLIISEMPPGRMPGPGAFPIRNRLISGLCLGVLVTEASHVHSGTLITARLAAEQGRNVYVPSPDILPCREGTKRMLEILERIVAGNGELEDLDLLEDLARTITETALCGLGKSAALPVMSTLRLFRDEYVAHVVDKRCESHTCSALKRYVISPERCKGCSKCARNCPADAISGKIKEPFEIDPKRCIKCGACESACAFGAIHVEW